jgi:hypothetical protein
MSAAAKSGIDVSLIPNVDVTNLCRDFLSAVEAFYQDPQNVQKFEKWKEERRHGKNG